MKTAIRALFALLVLTTIGCKENIEKNEDVISTEQEIIKSLENWNQAHNEGNSKEFEQLYSDEVLYYGETLNVAQILKSKQSLFRKYPSFKQEIDLQTTEIPITDESYKVAFDKKVTINNKTTTYPSYLSFIKDNESWKITVEGDLVTDENLAKSKTKTIETNERSNKNTEKVYGDFNGDGKKEYAWIEMPELVYHEDIDDSTEEKIDFGYYECIGGCNAIIRFSDKTINPITIYNVARSVGLEKVGDWNNDGKDELGITERSRSDKHAIYNVDKAIPIAPYSWIKVNIHEQLYFESLFKKVGKDKIKVKSSHYTDTWMITDTIVSIKEFDGAAYLESQKGEVITRYYNY